MVTCLNSVVTSGHISFTGPKVTGAPAFIFSSTPGVNPLVVSPNGQMSEFSKHHLLSD